MRQLIFLIVLMLAACTQREHKEVSSSSLDVNDSTVATSFETSLKIDNFEIKTFAVQPGGYWYEIFKNGSEIIYQPTIAGLPSNTGFTTTEKTQKIKDLLG
jgi:Domain of unknown function (DUF4907)